MAIPAAVFVYILSQNDLFWDKLCLMGRLISCSTLFWIYLPTLGGKILSQTESPAAVFNSTNISDQNGRLGQTGSQCCQNFFLKITDVGPKKNEKNGPKSPKKREKNEFSTINCTNFDPPYYFYCIFMHEYFSKLKRLSFFCKNFFSKVSCLLEKKRIWKK